MGEAWDGMRMGKESGTRSNIGRQAIQQRCQRRAKFLAYIDDLFTHVSRLD